MRKDQWEARRQHEAQLELHQMMISDILERRRLARQDGGTSSSGLGESPMSGGDGGVHDELHGDRRYDLMISCIHQGGCLTF
jgi:hypothetical protein